MRSDKRVFGGKEDEKIFKIVGFRDKKTEKVVLNKIEEEQGRIKKEDSNQ
ncbi:MAG: hypothetical protein AAB506_00635 [Patescibacteria group bacterium]